MKHLMLALLVLAAQSVVGQKYFSKTGKITFYSEAPMEKIEAQNSSASTVLDVATGQLEWAVLIQGFQFEKALMQEHFNENYMESTKFPKAKFKGKVDNMAAINLTKDGTYKAAVSGQLEIHGVTKPVSVEGTFVVKAGKITANSKFTVAVADYGIEIPKLVAENIAKTVDIHVETSYQLMAASQ